MSDLDWHGDDALDHCRKRAVAFLTRAALEVQRRAKELLSIAGTAVRSQTSRGGRKGSRIYNANPSAPGEPPHKQTGRLRASVTHEVDPATLQARVGTNIPYGRFLETGTKRGIAPRPWLRRALAECAAKINALLAQIGGNE